MYKSCQIRIQVGVAFGKWNFIYDEQKSNHTASYLLINKNSIDQRY